MNLALDSQQTEELRNCYETMRHSFPTHQFVFAPVLIPAAEDGTGTPWITGVYEVHWPMFRPDGVSGFMWVSPDGTVVTTDYCPEAEAYYP